VQNRIYLDKLGIILFSSHLPMSKFRSYIDKHTKARYRLKKYLVFFIFLAVVGGVSSNYISRCEYYLRNSVSLTQSSGESCISSLIEWYNSAAFVDENLFTDALGVFPDLNELARQEMAWLARMWFFWGGAVGIVGPLVLFLLFQFGKRIWDRTRQPPSLDEQDVSTYLDIQKRIRRAFWRANNHNFEKAIFLVSLLGISLFGIQFFFQPFVIIPHHFLVSVLIAFLIYASVVYFFYLFWQRYPYSRVIRVIDREMKLRQSLITALDRSKDYRKSPLYLYLLKETRDKMREKNVLDYFPLKFPSFNRRNVGITVSSLAGTIFFVSISLPAVALVYDSLRREIDFLTPNKKNIEQIILDESDQIQLLSKDLQKREEFPESTLLAIELSNLAEKLEKIVQTGNDMGNIQTMNFKLTKERVPQKRELIKKKEKKKKESSQAKAKIFQEEDVSTIETMDIVLTAQINSLIEDLARYDLENRVQEQTASIQRQPTTTNTDTPANSSSSILASKGSVNQPRGSNVQGAQEDVPDTLVKDKKKLQKFISQLDGLLNQINQLIPQTPNAQLADSRDNELPRSDENRAIPSTQRGSGRLSEEKVEMKQSDSTPSSSQKDDGLPKDKEDKEDSTPQDGEQERVPNYNSFTDAIVQNLQIPFSKADEEQGKNETRRKYPTEEIDEEEKQKVEILYPANIIFIKDELKEITEGIHDLVYDWREVDGVDRQETMALTNRVRMNSQLLKNFSNKLVSITQPESIIGIPANAINSVVEIKNPKDIRSKVRNVIDKGIQSPAQIKALATDLRLVANDLDSINAQVEEFVMGQRGISNFQSGFNEKNSVIREVDDLARAKNAYKGNLADQEGSSDNERRYVSQFQPESSRTNVTSQKPTFTLSRLAGMNRKKMQARLSQGRLQFFRSGIDPGGGARYIEKDIKEIGTAQPSSAKQLNPEFSPRSSRNLSKDKIRSSEIDLINIKRSLKDSTVGEVVADLENLRIKARNLDNANTSPRSHSSNDRSSVVPEDLINRVGELSDRIKRERDPENLKNLTDDLVSMVSVARDQIIRSIPAGQLDNKVPSQEGLKQLMQNIDQKAQSMLQEKNPANLKNLSSGLAQQVLKYKEEFQQISDNQPPVSRKDQQKLELQQEMDWISNQAKIETDPKRLQTLGKDLARVSRQLRNQALGENVSPEELTAAKHRDPEIGSIREDFSRLYERMGSERDLSRFRSLGKEFSQLMNRYQKLERQQGSSLKSNNLPKKQQQVSSKRLAQQYTNQYPDQTNQFLQEAQRSQNKQRAASGNNAQLLAQLDRALGTLTSRMSREKNLQNRRDLANQMNRKVQDYTTKSRQDGSQSPDQKLGINRRLTLLGDQIQDLNRQMQSEQNPRNLDRLQGKLLEQVRQLREGAQQTQNMQRKVSGDNTEELARLDRSLENFTNRFSQESKQENRLELVNQMAQMVQDITGQGRQNHLLSRERSSESSQPLISLGKQIQNLSQQMQNESNSQNFDRLQSELLENVKRFRRQAPKNQDRRFTVSSDNTQALSQLDRGLADLASQMREGANLQERRNSADQMTRLIKGISTKGGQYTQLFRDQDSRLNHQMAFWGKQILDLSNQMQNEKNSQNLKRLQQKLLERVDQFREEIQKSQSRQRTLTEDNAQQMARLDRDLEEMAKQVRQTEKEQARKDLARQLGLKIRDFIDRSKQNAPLSGGQNFQLTQQMAFLNNKIQYLNSRMQNERNPQNLKRLKNNLIQQTEQFRKEIQKNKDKQLTTTEENPQTPAQLDRDLAQLASQMRLGINPQLQRDLADQIAQRVQKTAGQSFRDGVMPRDLTKNLDEKQQEVSLKNQAEDLSLRVLNEQSQQTLNYFEQDHFDRQQDSYPQVQNPPHPSFAAKGDNTKLMAQFKRSFGEISHQTHQETKQMDNINLVNLMTPHMENSASQDSRSGRLQGESARDVGQNQQQGLMGRDISALSPKSQVEKSPQNMNRLDNDTFDQIVNFEQQIQTITNPIYSSQSEKNSEVAHLNQNLDQLAFQGEGSRNQGNRKNRTTQQASSVQNSQQNQKKTNNQEKLVQTSQNRGQLAALSKGIQALSDQIQKERDQEKIQDIKEKILEQFQEFQNQAFGKRLNPTQQTDLQNQKIADLIAQGRKLNERLRQERNPKQARLLSDQLSSTIQEIRGLTSDEETRRQTGRNKTPNISPSNRQRQESASRFQPGADQRGLLSHVRGNSIGRQRPSTQMLHEEIQQDKNPQSQSRRKDPLDTPQWDNQHLEQSNLNRGFYQNNQQIVELDRRMKQLSRDLRRESDPNRIRDLNNQVSQLTNRLRNVFQDQSRSSQSRQPSDKVDNLLGQIRRLSDSIDSEQDSGRLSNLKDQLSDNLSLLQNQQVANLNRRIEQLSRDLRQESDPNRIRDLSNQVSRLTNRLQNDFQDQSRLSQGRQVSDRINNLLGQIGRLSDSILSEQESSRLSNLKDQLSDNLSLLQSRQVAKLDRRIEQLSRDLRQENNPNRIRDLSNQASRLANRFWSDFQDQNRLPQNRQASHKTGNLLGQLFRLIDSIRSEQDSSRLSNLKDQLSDNLFQLHNQQVANLDHQMGQLSRDLHQESDPNRIRDLNNQVSRLANQLQNDFQDQSRSPQSRQASDKINVLLGQMFRLTERIRSEQDSSRLSNLKEQLSTNLSQLHNQRIADLDQQMLQLSDELRRETDPVHIQDLNNEVSRLARQLQRDFQDQSHQSQNRQASDNTDSLLGQMRHLSASIRSEQDPDKLRTDKNRLADNISSMRSQFSKLTQKITKDQIIPERRKTSDRDDLSEYGLPQPANYDSVALRMEGTMQQKRHGDDQRRMQRSEQWTEEWEANFQEQAEKDQRKKIMAKDDSRQEESFIDSYALKIGSLSQNMQSVEDPNTVRRLQQEMVDITERMFKHMAPFNQPTNVSEDPRRKEIDVLNDRIKNLADKLSSDQPVDKIKNSVHQLSTLSQKMVKKLSMFSGNEQTGSQQKQQLFQKMISSIQKLADRIQDTKDRDSVIENSKQLAKLTKQLKDLTQQRIQQPQEATTSKQQYKNSAQKDLIDASMRVQWIANKMLKEDDVKKLQDYQKQLLEFSEQMMDSMKKVSHHTATSVPDELLPTKEEKEIAEQFRQLSQKLKKVNDSTELKKISDRMDRIAKRLLTRQENQVYSSSSGKREYRKGVSSVTVKTEDIDKDTSSRFLGKDGDKDSGNNQQMRAALAINKIEETIQKLKTYGSADNSRWKNSSNTPKGATSMGSGSSQQPLPLADRVVAKKVVKETNQVPDTKSIRNILSMEKDLDKKEVFDRIIRRLETYKKKIKQSSDAIVSKDDATKDSPDIEGQRRASKQPAGLENIRFSPDEPVKEPFREKTKAVLPKKKTVSYMESNQNFLNSRLKTKEETLLEMIPESKMKIQRKENVRIPASQKLSDSVIEDTVPPNYQSILRRLFSNKNETAEKR